VAAVSLRLALLKQLDGMVAAVDTGYRHLHAFASEVISSAARPEEWVELSARAYGRNALYTSEEHNGRLFDWEEQAIERHFPPPPARLLVAASGGGRELRCLARRGYVVAGFDPVPSLVRHARRIVDRGRLLGCEVASYGELVAGRLSLERLAPFDAVILGWASLGHVGEPALRRALLPAVRRLCPDGPVLASWASGGSERKGWIRPLSSGARVRRLRRVLSALGFSQQTGAEFYSPQGGLSHLFTREEIFELAGHAGYRVLAFEEIHNYPHAVLAPASPDPRG
jgi:hypothetical protein